VVTVLEPVETIDDVLAIVALVVSVAGGAAARDLEVVTSNFESVEILCVLEDVSLKMMNDGPSCQP
jgi:hypothetical protein